MQSRFDLRGVHGEQRPSVYWVLKTANGENKFSPFWPLRSQESSRWECY